MLFKSKFLLLTLFFAVVNFKLTANNIRVANVTLTNQNTSSDYTMVQFDLDWDNSWRLSSGPSNWDAAWVFVKYRVNGGDWLHAYLNNTGHLTGTGTSTTLTSGLLNTDNAFNASTNPAVGVFVHRSADGSGTFVQTGMRLRWNYGVNGISDDDVVDIKVFAVEMVYVPQGSFELGDGTTTTVTGQLRDAGSNIPFTVSSEGALTLGGTTAGNLGNNNASGMSGTPDDFNNTTTKSLPANHPKGYSAFYCMKYEISQQQWVDFFNTLNNTQKSTRDITGGVASSTGKATDAISFRNNVSWSSGDATIPSGTHANAACNFLSAMDGMAFVDWAGLRPMSEMEYEKACRGTVAAVANEYAWGSTSVTVVSSISNSGANNEVPTTAGQNAVYNNNAAIRGPIRVGAFATSTSTRAQAGASYYGIMELSGNLWERPTTLGHSTGRGLTRSVHGDGILSTAGQANVSTWPGYSAGENTVSAGHGFRGGNWFNIAAHMRVSDRVSGSVGGDARHRYYGYRGVRSMP
jgi:formylglycine-generating enzyme required for sulfatase activity